jgi:hypothetical protein
LELICGTKLTGPWKNSGKFIRSWWIVAILPFHSGILRATLAAPCLPQDDT